MIRIEDLPTKRYFTFGPGRSVILVIEPETLKRGSTPSTSERNTVGHAIGQAIPHVNTATSEHGELHQGELHPGKLIHGELTHGELEANTSTRTNTRPEADQDQKLDQHQDQDQANVKQRTFTASLEAGACASMHPAAMHEVPSQEEPNKARDFVERILHEGLAYGTYVSTRRTGEPCTGCVNSLHDWPCQKHGGPNEDQRRAAWKQHAVLRAPTTPISVKRAPLVKHMPSRHCPKCDRGLKPQHGQHQDIVSGLLSDCPTLKSLRARARQALSVAKQGGSYPRIGSSPAADLEPILPC